MIFKIRSIIHLIVVLPVSVSFLAGCARFGNLGQTQPIPSTKAPDSPVSPLDPIPGEDKMKRGEATVGESDILLLESYPVQVMLSLKGTLSTPCHHLRAKVSQPDTENRIQVELYSLYDPNEICIQVLQQFETNIPLGSYPAGSYTVWLNDKQVGDFTQ